MGTQATLTHDFTLVPYNPIFCSFILTMSFLMRERPHSLVWRFEPICVIGGSNVIPNIPWSYLSEVLFSRCCISSCYCLHESTPPYVSVGFSIQCLAEGDLCLSSCWTLVCRFGLLWWIYPGSVFCGLMVGSQQLHQVHSELFPELLLPGNVCIQLVLILLQMWGRILQGYHLYLKILWKIFLY